MLDHAEVIFDNMTDMMKKLKKASYEKNMKAFREEHGHFFREMTDYAEAEEDKEAAAEHIADVFTGVVEEHFSVKGKIKSRTQADLNFFMIYYVFPAILLTEHEEADRIAAAICKRWGERFRESKIGYTTYDKIYGAFKEKIFGIF